MTAESVSFVDACRMPVGRLRPDDLAAHAIAALRERNPLVDAAEFDDVLCGAANRAVKDNRNVARMSRLLAGLPVEVAGAP